MLKIIPFLALLLICGSAHAEQSSEQLAGKVAEAATLPSVASAQKLIDQGRDADAIGTLQQLINTSPDHFQAWFLLGVTQAKERRFHDAIASFAKVVSLQPKLAEPHNNLAVIYNELGDFRAAVKELEASLKLKPDYATAHENIGDLYVKLAADAYRKALKFDGRPALRQRYDRLLYVRDTHQPETVVDKQAVRTGIENTALKPAGQGHESSGQQAGDHQDSGHSIAEAQPPVPQTPVSSQTVILDTESQVAVHRDAVEQVVAPTPAVRVSSGKDDIKSALAAVETWRSAWNRQDLTAYFTSYSDAFDFGSRFKTLEQWKHYKQWVITKRTFIRVTLENIEAKKLSEGVIRLVFLQHFRSDSFNSDDIKEMLLRQTQDGWKIIHEASQ